MTEGDPFNQGEQHEQPTHESEIPQDIKTLQPVEGQADSQPTEDESTEEQPENPDGVLAVKKDDTIDDGHEDHEGRYDIDKASAVAHAMQESGFAGEQDSEWRGNSLYLDAARNAVDYHQRGLEAITPEVSDQLELEAQVEEAELSEREASEQAYESRTVEAEAAHEEARSRLREARRREQDFIDRDDRSGGYIRDRESPLYARNRLRKDAYIAKHELSNAEKSVRQLKERAVQPFAELYEMNPGQFASMPTSEFVERAKEYTDKLKRLELAEATVKSHDAFIEVMDEDIADKHSQYYLERVSVHYTDENNPHNEISSERIAINNGRPLIDNFSMGFIKGLIRIGKAEERIEGSDDEKTNVIKRMIELEDDFGLSARDRMTGYRDLVAQYWKPKAEAGRVAAEADLNEFLNRVKKVDQSESAAAAA